MTNINDLIQSGAILKIETSAEDLRTFGQEIATKLIQDLQELINKDSDIQYITGAKVCELLDISRVTLWNWDKRGITKPIRLGNLKRYKRSDIEGFAQKQTENFQEQGHNIPKS